MNDSPGSLYAMYVQATRLDENSKKTRRRQWVAMPPLTEPIARRAGVDPDDRMLRFVREQSTPENRVAWRWEILEPELLATDLPAALRAVIRENSELRQENRWTVSPIITAQVTARELSELLKEPKTPYRVLNRFTKVAAKVHGLSI